MRSLAFAARARRTGTPVCLGPIAAICTAIWVGLAPLPAHAMFETPQTCTGVMLFHNEDGSFETYSLALEFSTEGYVIRAWHLGTQEITEDEGTCTTYLAEGCRHMVPGIDGQADNHYDFRLEPIEAGGYLYREIWGDGFADETTVQCRPTDAG